MKLSKEYTLFLPAVSIILIILTSPFITAHYPGGSILNPNSEGFDWFGNYWCHLYEKTALNGQPNSARILAIISSSILTVTLISFFLIVGNLNREHTSERKIILFFGVLGMVFTPLGMTENHDIGVILAGSLCAIAVIAICSILRKERKYSLLILGLTWCVLFLINYAMYFKNTAIETLPLIQRISFTLFFAWIVLVNYDMAKNYKLKTSKATL